MGNLLEDIKGNLIFVATKGIESKIDGREIGRNLDKALDSKISEKASEKIQRFVIRNFFKEVIEGLCDEDLKELSGWALTWSKELEEKIGG